MGAASWEMRKRLSVWSSEVEAATLRGVLQSTCCGWSLASSITDESEEDMARPGASGTVPVTAGGI